MPGAGPLLTCEEAAKYLGAKERTGRTLSENRCVPVVKVGRYVRFRKRDLDELAKSSCAGLAT